MGKNKKGGRPRAGKVQKKAKAVTVRYGALQYDIVRYRSKKAGYKTVTEYVRDSSVNAEVADNRLRLSDYSILNIYEGEEAWLDIS